jgi:hypothetical protein
VGRFDDLPGTLQTVIPLLARDERFKISYPDEGLTKVHRSTDGKISILSTHPLPFEQLLSAKAHLELLDRS